MRVTLERADLIRILSKELGYDIDEEDITVSSDPFEVQIQHLPVDHLAAKATSSPDPEQYEPDDSQEDEEEESGGVLTIDDIMMDDVVAKNNMLTKQPTNNEQVRRPLGPNEFVDPPPVDTAELGVGLDAIKRLAGG